MTQTLPTKSLIVSHAADLDGVTSAVVVDELLRLHCRESIDVVFANYDDALSLIQEHAPKYDEIWITDLSWKPGSPLMESLAHIAPENRWLVDHHASSAEMMEVWKGQANILFDPRGAKCAADLCWDRACEVFREMLGENAPSVHFETLQALVKATHSRDLWVQDDPMGNILTDVLTEIGPYAMFRQMQRPLLQLDVDLFPAEWQRAIAKAARAREKSCKVAERSLSEVRVNDAPALMVCLSLGHSSDVGHHLLSTRGLGWVAMICPGASTISFRTNQETIDRTGVAVNDIAARMHPEGGGHPCAAGCPLDPKYLIHGTESLKRDLLELLSPALVA